MDIRFSYKVKSYSEHVNSDQFLMVFIGQSNKQLDLYIKHL